MKNTKAHIVVIFLAVAALYGWTLHYPFVFDDTHTIVQNPYITSLGYIKEYFVRTAENASKIHHGSFRPLWYLSFAVNYASGGLDPAGYRIFNIAVHAINSVLVYLIAAELFGRRSGYGFPAAAFSGLVFALHPLQTESVTYIVGRSGSLAALFCLAGLLAYIRFSGRTRAAAVFFFFCMALMSKENAVAFPLLLLLYETTSEREPRRYGLAASMLGLSGAFTAFRFYIAGLEKGPVISRSIPEHWMSEAYVIPQYLRKVFLPFGLDSDYDIRVITSAADPNFYVSAALILVLLYSLVMLYRYNRLACFLASWFFVMLIPETAMPIADLMADHRTYMPLAGIALLAGYAFTWFNLPACATGRCPRHRTAALAACIMLAAFAGTAAARNSVYSSDRAFWEDAAAKSPGKARPFDSLGRIEYFSGNKEKAEDLLKKSIALDPKGSDAVYNLSCLLTETGRLDEALEYNRLASAMNPDDPIFLEGIADIYSRKGLIKEADAAFQKAIAAQPDLAATYTEYGKFLVASRRYAEAVKILNEAVALAPSDDEARAALTEAKNGSR